MKKLFALILALSLIFSLAACAPEEPGTPDTPDTPGSPDTPTVPDEPDTPDTPDTPDSPDAPDTSDTPDTPGTPELPGGVTLSVGISADPSGLAAAGLHGKTGYEVKVTDDFAGAFAAGEIDAAVLPVSDAARLYNTGTPIVLAAIIMSGGWEIVDKDGLESIFDLAGKTVYLPSERPTESRLFEYIATEYGFIVGGTLSVSYVSESELAGKDTAMLPSYEAQGRAPTLNLRDEWENVTGYSLLPTAGLVLSAGLEDDIRDALTADFSASLNSASDNVSQAVELGIAEDESEAELMLSSCGFLWITGANTMREELSGYFGALYTLDPAFIGGYYPDDGFYGG